MQSIPHVSVIVPAFNAEKYIGNCVNSLLNLDYPKEKYEIIVVNNASSDNTDLILNKYNREIVLLYEQKKGASAARNKGIKYSSEADIVAFTDADCVVDTKWLTQLVKHLENERFGIVGGRIKSLTPCNFIEYYGNKINDNEMCLKDEILPFCISMNWASRLSVIKEVGMFDEDLLRSHDVDLSWRIIRSGFELYYEPDAIVYHKNIDNLPELFYKGFVHGFYGTKLLSKHYDVLKEKGIKRLYWSTYLDIIKSLIKSVTGLERGYWVCNLVFNTGKKIGKYLGSARFGYVNL